MTRLLHRKTKARYLVESVVRGRPLCVELAPYSVIVREKGRRRSYEISWDSIFWLGANISAEAARRARLAARKSWKVSK
jgi:hypothetical protein